MRNGSLHVYQKDREKVVTEIAQCQARVVQTMVPTILALGLIAVADAEKAGVLTFGCAFAILFCSSLYVASLSCKIFQNGAFLKVFGPDEPEPSVVYWEDALATFREKDTMFPIHSETWAAAVIYVVLSLTFFFIFYRERPIAATVCAVVLLSVAIGVAVIYSRAAVYEKRWIATKDELLEERDRKADPGQDVTTAESHRDSRNSKVPDGPG